MPRETRLSRRKVLRTTGVAVGTALVAGCGGGPSGENGSGDGEGGNETESEDGGGETSEWEGVEEIELGGETAAWQGQAPSPIEGQENPTLVLFEGQQYTVTWENLDGAQHNFEIWDENDEVVDDHSTELMGEQGETQTHEFEATSEMARYVCNPHEGTMNGEIQVESDGGGGAGGGNESEENATDENATEENATEENATDENESNGNATEENATDENASDENATGENATDENESE